MIKVNPFSTSVFLLLILFSAVTLALQLKAGTG